VWATPTLRSTMGRSIGGSVGGGPSGKKVSREPKTMIFGLGYGYPWESLTVRRLKRRALDLHIISFISHWLFRVHRRSDILLAGGLYLPSPVANLPNNRQNIRSSLFTSQFFGYFFGNAVETPPGGIYIYLLIGLYGGPMFAPKL